MCTPSANGALPAAHHHLIAVGTSTRSHLGISRLPCHVWLQSGRATLSPPLGIACCWLAQTAVRNCMSRQFQVDAFRCIRFHMMCALQREISSSFIWRTWGSAGVYDCLASLHQGSRNRSGPTCRDICPTELCRNRHCQTSKYLGCGTVATAIASNGGVRPRNRPKLSRGWLLPIVQREKMYLCGCKYF